jgi:hypothetical protein
MRYEIPRKEDYYFTLYASNFVDSFKEVLSIGDPEEYASDSIS